jgi:hypothetical protein
MICLIDAGILVLGGAIGNLMLQILVGQFSGGNSRLVDPCDSTQLLHYPR